METRTAGNFCEKKVGVADYRIEDIDPELWRAVKDKAAYEGRSVRFVLLEFLKLYAVHGYHVIETFKNHRKK